jgi:hypothetical protein
MWRKFPRRTDPTLQVKRWSDIEAVVSQLSANKCNRTLFLRITCFLDEAGNFGKVSFASEVWTTFTSGLTIDREITSNGDSTWKYVLTKTGTSLTGTVNPLL